MRWMDGHRHRFQSTHPARGATYIVASVPDSVHISIHAPREGCDSHAVDVVLQKIISIHAPREGCDIFCQSTGWVIRDFNPRTPRGVRRKQSGQSHRPSHYFNPRTPRGVRHWATYGWCELQIISIHAPREGCDLDGGGDQFHRLVISIHAPREGCDAIYPHATIVAWGFQSTHPARGATTQYPKIARRKFYFNPRTPRGVRRQQG